MDEANTAVARDCRLRGLLSNTGLTVLFFLLSQNLLQFPFLLLRNRNIFLSGQGLSPFSSQLISVTVYLVSMGLTIVVGLYLFRSDHEFAFPMARVRQDYLRPALGVGLGAAMVGSLAATAADAWLGMGGIYSRQNLPSFAGGLPTLLLTLFGVTVLPALLEELLFRGVLLQPLRRYGDGLAVVVSAAFFALCHPTLPQAINAFVVGLALGVFAVRTGSLALPMMVHFVYNCLSCVITLFSLYRPLHAALFSWVVVLSLVGLGIVCLVVLRRRFGPVWHLPRARMSVDNRMIWRSVLTSVPALAAAVLCLVTILGNLYLA